MRDIQVHRYSDKVALWIGLGETIYLTEEEAKELGTVLKAYAFNIKYVSFTESQIGTYETEVNGEKE